MIIKRSIINTLYKDFSVKESTILVGPRQVGKTFLLRQLEYKARTDSKKTAFFDLEQPADLAHFNQSEAEIIHMLSHAGKIIFIDEFHYLKNASKIFKAIYDSNVPIKIFASGSSALEIHTHLKESLVGRKLLYHILPCGFEELESLKLGKTFEYLCIYGGMPGIVQQETPDRKKQLLVDILQSYLLKDIKSLIREENLRAFNHLLYLLAQSQGSVVSIDSLARDVGMSPHTINSYLDILAQTYVNFPVASYSQNLGNELRKSKKFYLYDLGVRNALLKNFASFESRKDKGILAETFVFHELQKKLSPETQIRFWRLKSGEEVDFLWIKNQIPYPIEVKTSWNHQSIPKGLQSFLRRYPDTQEAFVITNQSKKTIKLNHTNIHFLPFSETRKIMEII